MLSGVSPGIPGVSPMLLREEQRSYESAFSLLYTPTVFGDFPIVRTPTRNFTSSDFNELFELSGVPHGVARYEKVGLLTSDLVHPGVNVTHLYGTGLATDLAYRYDGADDASFQKGDLNPLP